MHLSFHHRARIKKNIIPKSHHTGLKKLMDESVYLFAFLGVAANIPQLVKLWQEKSAGGVSIITWVGFFTGSLFWLCYGIIHKEKPIMVANFFFAIIQGAIIMSLFMFR